VVNSFSFSRFPAFGDISCKYLFFICPLRDLDYEDHVAPFCSWMLVYQYKLSVHCDDAVVHLMWMLLLLLLHACCSFVGLLLSLHHVIGSVVNYV
jgi:hypothetical protein